MTTASTRTGLWFASYSTVTWLLPSGRRYAILPFLRTSLSFCSQLVRQRDRRRHQLRRLVGGVAEHHALVAGAAGVHALRDVRRLAVDRRDHRAGVRVEALERVVVADLLDRLAHQRLEVDVGLGRDLAGNDHQAGAGQRLAGHAAVGVLRQAGIENRVGDLVGDLVGMTLGHGLTGKQKTVGVLAKAIVLLIEIAGPAAQNATPDDRPLARWSGGAGFGRSPKPNGTGCAEPLYSTFPQPRNQSETADGRIETPKRKASHRTVGHTKAKRRPPKRTPLGLVWSVSSSNEGRTVGFVDRGKTRLREGLCRSRLMLPYRRRH